MDKVWYYMKPDMNKFGPYTDEQIISLIKNEILLSDDYIWMPDMENWLKIGDSIYSIYLPSENQVI